MEFTITSFGIDHTPDDILLRAGRMPLDDELAIFRPTVSDYTWLKMVMKELHTPCRSCDSCVMRFIGRAEQAGSAFQPIRQPR